MRTLLTSQRTLAAALALLALPFIAHVAPAQDVCSGDLNRDGVVTADDADALAPLLFVDLLLIDIDTLMRADVNDDGALSAADIVAVLALDGFPCPAPPHTPTPTATPTPAPPMTPTPTRTRPPTSPTPVCEVIQASLGATSGTLAASDCQRVFAGQMRLVDVYSITAAPGTAIQVELTAVAPLAGYVVVLDPAGQFGTAEGTLPIRFTVTSGKAYQIQVTSRPGSDVQMGDYSLTLTSIACAAPVALSFGTARAFNLDGTECPEPALPSIGPETEPTDVFTFTVNDVPKNVSITMQQLSVNEDIFPVLALLGPDGYEPVAQDDNLDCTAATGTLLCAQIRFLALQRGTYTILATGSGGTGRYSLALASPTCNPKMLTGIPSDTPLNCPGSSLGCMGALTGNTVQTSCAAPLSSPENPDVFPEPGSAADLYSFTANAGDVISVQVASDDAPHLYLVGPSPANPFVTTSNGIRSAGLAATLALPGTYTIVAANDNLLFPEDAPVNYTLLVQKCPAQGGLNLLTGRQVSGTYSTVDCRGSHNIPYRSYAFSGLAGQFVTTTMTSSNVDSFVRVYAPDGSRVENDDDPFRTTADARAGRILPMDGTYFVEVSASPAGPPVDVGTVPPPAFTLRARLCATTPAVPGHVSGTWQDGDCDLGASRTGDIYTFPAGATPAVATLSPPDNGCVLALLGDGTQVPRGQCSTAPIDIPTLGSAVHGFIVASGPATRGAYTAGFSRCPIGTIGVGDSRHGTLDGTNCADADGIRADWFLIEAPAGVLQFNVGLTGRIDARFPLAALLSDLGPGAYVTGSFNEDPTDMFSVGNDLAVVLRVTGETPSDQGTYDLLVDPAALRE